MYGYRFVSAELMTQGVDAIKTRRRIMDALPKLPPNSSDTTEKLIKIAEIANVRVAYASEAQNKRPCFGPDQVRSACQIKKGLHYGLVFQGGTNTYVVTKEPFLKDDDWWIEAQEKGLWEGRQKGETGFNFSFLGIHPYKNGIWTKQAYLAFTEESKALKCLCPDHHPCCN